MKPGEALLHLRADIDILLNEVRAAKLICAAVERLVKEQPEKYGQLSHDLRVAMEPVAPEADSDLGA